MDGRFQVLAKAREGAGPERPHERRGKKLHLPSPLKPPNGFSYRRAFAQQHLNRGAFTRNHSYSTSIQSIRDRKIRSNTRSTVQRPRFRCHSCENKGDSWIRSAASDGVAMPSTWRECQAKACFS